MIILDTGDKSLELILGGAVTSSQLPWTTSYITIGNDESVTPGNSYGLSNGGTLVTIIDSPDPKNDIQLKALTVINKDTVNATVTIQEDDASIPTTTPLITVILRPGDTLQYIDTDGWRIFDSFGNIRTTSTSNGMSGSDGQLANAKGTIFTATVPCRIRGITLVSSDNGTYTVNLYIKRVGGGNVSRRIIPKDKSLSDDLQYPPIADIYHYLAAGDLIEGDASSATKVDYLVSVEAV